MAADLSYRYVEANGVFGTSGGKDSTGVAFDASYDLGGVLFATAGLRRSDVDTEPESDGEFYRLGLGVRRGVTESLDVLLMAHYGRLDVSAPAPSGGTHNILDETGALIDLGIRGQIGTAAEYSLLATFVDLADRGWGYRAGGRFQLGKSPYSLGCITRALKTIGISLNWVCVTNSIETVPFRLSYKKELRLLFCSTLWIFPE